MPQYCTKDQANIALFKKQNNRLRRKKMGDGLGTDHFSKIKNQKQIVREHNKPDFTFENNCLI